MAPHLEVPVNDLVEVHVLHTLENIAEVLPGHTFLDGNLIIDGDKGVEGQGLRTWRTWSTRERVSATCHGIHHTIHHTLLVGLLP